MKVSARTLLPVIFLSLLFGASTPLTAKDRNFSYNLDEVYPISPDGALTLITSDADVTITGSERKDVRLVVDKRSKIIGLSFGINETFEMEVTPQDGNLMIREIGESGSFIGIASYTNNIYEISLEVPKEVKLKIRGDDDSYSVADMAGEIRMQFDDGRARLNRCSGSQFEFDFEDGRVEMDGGAGILDASFEDGRLLIENGSFSEVNAECEDGYIEIETSLTDKGLYRIYSEDGRIELHVLKGGGEFQVLFEDGRVRASSAFKLIDSDDDSKTFQLKDGTARVRLQTEDGSIQLSSE